MPSLGLGLGLGFGGGVKRLAATVENFPFLANSLLWHQDDVTDDTSTDWTDRFGGIVIRPPSGNWLKDANGVHRLVDLALTVVGALPDPTGKHVVLVETMVLTVSNSVNGLSAFYDADAGGAAGFIQSSLPDFGAFFYYGGVNGLNYMEFDDAPATAYDLNTPLAGFTYVNFAVAAGTGSAAHHAGKVSGVNSAKVSAGALTGDMTTALTPAGNPGDEVAIQNHSSGGIRTKLLGLLIMTQAPTDLQAAAEYMRDNPGYLPIQWAGLS